VGSFRAKACVFYFLSRVNGTTYRNEGEVLGTTENRINAKLKSWNMSIDAFCVLACLCGSLPLMSKSAAWRALQGQGTFGAEAALALNELIRDIETIITAAEPLPLNLKNPAQVSGIIKAWKTGALTIDVRQQN
jgi:hypothetical protein